MHAPSVHRAPVAKSPERTRAPSHAGASGTSATPVNASRQIPRMVRASRHEPDAAPHEPRASHRARATHCPAELDEPTQSAPRIEPAQLGPLATGRARHSMPQRSRAQAHHARNKSIGR
jgi:hypothetical protein